MTIKGNSLHGRKPLLTLFEAIFGPKFGWFTVAGDPTFGITERDLPIYDTTFMALR